MAFNSNFNQLPFDMLYMVENMLSLKEVVRFGEARGYTRKDDTRRNAYQLYAGYIIKDSDEKVLHSMFKKVDDEMLYRAVLNRASLAVMRNTRVLLHAIQYNRLSAVKYIIGEKGYRPDGTNEDFSFSDAFGFNFENMSIEMIEYCGQYPWLLKNRESFFGTLQYCKTTSVLGKMLDVLNVPKTPAAVGEYNFRRLFFLRFERGTMDDEETSLRIFAFLCERQNINAETAPALLMEMALDYADFFRAPLLDYIMNDLGFRNVITGNEQLELFRRAAAPTRPCVWHEGKGEYWQNGSIIRPQNIQMTLSFIALGNPAN